MVSLRRPLLSDKGLTSASQILDTLKKSLVAPPLSVLSLQSRSTWYVMPAVCMRILPCASTNGCRAMLEIPEASLVSRAGLSLYPLTTSLRMKVRSLQNMRCASV